MTGLYDSGHLRPPHDERNLAWGRAAVNARWLSQDQAHQCLGEATRLGASILDVAVHHRLLTSDQATRIAEATPPPSPVSGLTPQPGMTPQPGYTSRPGMTPQPGYTPRPGMTPQPGYTPRPGMTPQPPMTLRPGLTPQPPMMPGSRTPGSGHPGSGLPGSGHPGSGSRAGRAPATRLPEVGDLIDGYLIKRELGRGGMGAVYVGARGTLEVAIKVILASGESALKRFQREASALAEVGRHPNIVNVRSFTAQGVMPVLVLDLVEGENLEDLLKREQRLPVERALEITAKIADALDFVHQKQILHRDMKPANVLIRAEDGEPLVTDFGLARAEDSEALTRTSEVLGTPHYMAPEQADPARTRSAGSSVDIWALGAILYRCLTGRLPFEGESAVELTAKIMVSDPTSPRSLRPELDRDIETIIMKALQKEPEERYPTAGELAEDCRRALVGQPVMASRVGLVRGAGRRLRRRVGRAGLASLLLIIVLVGIMVGATLFRESAPRQWVAELKRHHERVRTLAGRLDEELPQRLAAPLLAASQAPGGAGARGEDPVLKDLCEHWRALTDMLRESDSSPAKSAAFSDELPAEARAELETRAELARFLIAPGDAAAPDPRALNLPPGLQNLLVGIRALATGRRSEARETFQGVVRGRSLRFRPHARFGLALCRLAEGSLRDAGDQLARLEKEPLFAERCARLQMRVRSRELTEALLQAGLSDNELNRRFRVLDKAFVEADAREELWLDWFRSFLAELERRVKDSTGRPDGRLIAAVARYRRLRGKLAGLPRPMLPAALHQILGERALACGDQFEAIWHYGSAVVRDPSTKVPDGFATDAISDKILTASLGKDRRGLIDAYRLILAAGRAGILITVVRDDFLTQLEHYGVLEEQVARAPNDPIPLFWSALTDVSEALLAQGKTKSAMSRIEKDFEALSRVVEHPDTPPGYRAKAFWERAKLRAQLESVRGKGWLDYREGYKKDCERSLELPHPEPDRVYQALVIIAAPHQPADVVLGWLDEQARLLTDRWKRTTEGRVSEDRPPGCPLERCYDDNYDEWMCVIHVNRAEVLLRAGRKAEAEAAVDKAYEEFRYRGRELFEGCARVYGALGRKDKLRLILKRSRGRLDQRLVKMLQDAIGS